MTNISSSSRLHVSLSACALAASLLAACGGGGGPTTVEASATTASAALASSPAVASTGAASAAAAPSWATATSFDAAAPLAAGASAPSGAPLIAESGDRVTAAAACVAGTFGTFNRPFSADSPWNSRHINPVLGTATIPATTYYPSMDAGAWSSTAFKASNSDPAMVVTGTNGAGVWDPDSEVSRPSITIPHWPAATKPASGSDAHAEIVDEAAGVIHSFWGLKQVNGAWTTTQYAWTPLAGRGVGNPAHYYQGARAAGVSTLGGLIRIAEVNDGDTLYRHALAMSLDFSGLSPNPTYRFPATSSDTNAATANTGAIPMGSLLMLPASFNAQALATPELRKVAETLKRHGAYVVDRNYGTPFVIYVEIGASLQLHKNGWNAVAASELDAIRAALRPLASATSWVDGNGQTSTSVTATSQNLLSMRGYWYRTKGTVNGEFDTWRQALVFPATTTQIEQANTGGRAVAGVNWATPVSGESYKLSVVGTGGATFRMTINDKVSGATLYDSGYLADGQTTTFTWPGSNGFKVATWARSGTANIESTLRPTLVKATGATIAEPCTSALRK